MTALELPYMDCWSVQLTHETGIQGTLTIDLATRIPVRNLELFGEETYIIWNGSPEGLMQFDVESGQMQSVATEKAIHQTGYGKFIIENAYYNEIDAFFRVVQGNEKPRYSFEKDREILGLLDKIGV